MNLRQAAQQALEAINAIPEDVEGYLPESLTDAVVALRAALAEPEQPVAIKWTLNGHKHCGYDNWVGETPFGRILITWKSWKDFPKACVDEFPGGFDAYGDPDDVKDECEAEFRRRFGAAPTPRKPDDDEVEQLRAQNTELDAACEKLEAINDELVEALQMWMHLHETPAGFVGKWGKALDAAIAEQEVKVNAAATKARAALAKAGASK